MLTLCIIKMKGVKKAFLFALLTMMCMVVKAQDLTVQGKVTSQTDGEPIIGATVVEVGNTTNGIITDFDGNFTLVVKKGAELSVSYVGFRTATVKAQATVNVVLEEDIASLGEVVVTGYMAEKKAA